MSRHVIQLVLVCVLSALCVCPVVRVFFSFCFTRVFFCVCRYILCHLYYYLMLVRLDCTSCAHNVYFVCIVCGHHGNLSTSHTCGSHAICSLCFLFFALYFVFYLHFKCLYVFALVRVLVEGFVCLFVCMVVGFPVLYMCSYVSA
jgi:hypothetical protein